MHEFVSYRFAPSVGAFSIEKEDGTNTWCVRRGDTVIASGLTNAKAWELADKLDSEGHEIDEAHHRIGAAIANW